MSKIAKGIGIGILAGAFIIGTGGLGAGFLSGVAAGVGSAAAGIGIGLTATVAGAIAGGLIGAVYGGIMSLAQPKLADVQQQAGQKFAVTQSYDVYRKVYGSARVGGDEVFITAYDSTSGDDVPNDTLVIARVVAPHPVDSFGTFYLNDEAVSFDGNGNATGKYADKLYLKTYTGAQTTADGWLTTASATWTSSHKLTEQSYYVLKAVYDTEVFPYGIGTIRNARTDIQGANLYDPRLDSTQTAIGGSGTHRIDDNTTWEYSQNPALVAYDILRDSRLGVVVPEASIELSDIVALANHCDETVTVNAGGTIARYTFDGVIDCNRSKLDNLKMVMTSCAGRVGWQGGKLRMYGSYMSASVYTITEDDIRAITDYLPLPPEADRFNTVKGTYINPDEKYNAADYPAQIDSTALAAEGERAQTLNLPYTQDHRIGQRLAQIELNRAHRPVLSLEMMPVGLAINPWDIVTVTLSDLGISAQTFRVLDRQVNMSSGTPVVTVDLQEEDATTFAWDAATQELTRSAKASITESNHSGTVGSVQGDVYDSSGEALVQDAWFNKQSSNLSSNKAWTATSGFSFPTAKVALPNGNTVKVAEYTPTADAQEYASTRAGQNRQYGARLHNRFFFVSSNEVFNVAMYGTADSGTDGYARVGIAFYDKNGTYLEERINDDNIAPSTTGWGSVRRIITAPAGAVFGEFFILIRNCTSGKWKISGVDVKRVGLAADQNWQNMDGGDIAADILTADGMGFQVKRWDFAGDGLGWTFTDMTVSHTTLAAQITTTSNDPRMTSPAISINGGIYNLVWVRVKRRVAAAKRYDTAKIYYKTVSHGYSDSYVKVTTRRFLEGQYITFVFDMADLTRGGNDWTSNTITGIRLDPSASSSDEFDIDWIGIGRASAATLEAQALNVADPLAFTSITATDTDTDAQIGSIDLDDMGLEVGDALSAALTLSGSGSRKGRIYVLFKNSSGSTISSKNGDYVSTFELAKIESAIVPDGTYSCDFWLGRENSVSGSVGGSQLMVTKGVIAQRYKLARTDVAASATRNIGDLADLDTAAVQHLEANSANKLTHRDMIVGKDTKSSEYFLLADLYNLVQVSSKIMSGPRVRYFGFIRDYAAAGGTVDIEIWRRNDTSTSPPTTRAAAAAAGCDQVYAGPLLYTTNWTYFSIEFNDPANDEVLAQYLWYFVPTGTASYEFDAKFHVWQVLS